MLKEPTHRHKTDKFGNGQRAPHMMMMSHPPAENKNKTPQTWKDAIDATAKSTGISVWNADAI